MSNNEVFEKIFEDISNKIINQYLTTVSITKNKNKFRYTNNLKISTIISALNNNIDNIVSYLSKELKIIDVLSAKKILSEHINSKYFSDSIFQIAAVIETEKKLEVDNIKKTYSQHLKHYLVSKNVKEKVFALSKDTTFNSWLQRRWKVLGCGYALVILILLISYYVFISK